MPERRSLAMNEDRAREGVRAEPNAPAPSKDVYRADAERVDGEEVLIRPLSEQGMIEPETIAHEQGVSTCATTNKNRGLAVSGLLNIDAHHTVKRLWR